MINYSDNESSTFTTTKWYIINDQNNAKYGEENEIDLSIKFETEVIRSNICDYSHGYILVTGDITTTVGGPNINVAFLKLCAIYKMCNSYNTLVLLKILILQCLCTI